MTRIDFYLLSQTDDSSRDRFVCRLINKAYQRGHRCYLLTADAQQAQSLDRLLWTFSAGSFIPHAMSNCDTEHKPAVLIGHQDPPDDYHDILISMTPDIPQCFSRFARVAEVVDSSDDARQQARARYRFYRDRGYTMETHNL